MQSLVLGLINDWNGVWSILEDNGKSVDIRWYVTTSRVIYIQYKGSLQ